MAARARKADGSREVGTLIRTYLADLPPKARRLLRELHAVVRAAAPAAQPAFSYQMPAFAVDGCIIVWCAGWKQHVSLYPITKAMDRAGGPAIARYRHSKGTLKFDLDAPLPAGLVRRLIKARLAEMKAAQARS